MRKGLFFTMLLAVSALAFLTSCTTAKQGLIKEENISQLQGMWEGKRLPDGPSRALSGDVLTTLEITNGTLPLRGQINHHSGWGAGSVNPYPFENGVIKNGNLYIKNSRMEVTLALDDKGGNLRLTGQYYVITDQGSGYTGNYTLYKK